MVIFEISDDNIKKIKQNHLFIVIPALIIGSIITQVTIYFILQDNNIFFISLAFFVVIVFLITFFSLKRSLKSIEKSVKSIQYIFDNGRLIIKQNNFEQYNISKNDIKCINKYKNNIFIIILNNSKKIIVNKYLENHDGILLELKQLFEITEVDKSPYLLQNIFAGIIGIIVMGTFYLSKNLLLVIITSVLLFSFFLYLVLINIKNKNIEPKKKKMIYLLIPIIIFVIVDRILDLL
jgi:hypothetical protein